MSMTRGEMEAAYERLSPGAVRWARSYSSRLTNGQRMAEDYAQEARIGVWLGILRHDPQHGAQLASFTYTKARGAVAEARRRWDPRPRSVQEAGSTCLASGEALPAAWDLPVSLDGTVSWDGDLLLLADTLESDSQRPEEQALRAASAERLWAAVSRLRPRQQLVIVQHYVAGRSFREIAQLLGRSESRAYQIHEQALEQLRLLLAE